MPDQDTNLYSRIDAIEHNLRKLRHDIGRVGAMTTRNREDLDHALADVDELLYAALATGHELRMGQARPDPGRAGEDPKRCTHPTHDAQEPEDRPVATHLISLRTPRSADEQPHQPLPRCVECAARARKSPSASRIAISSIVGDEEKPGPRCQSPVHFENERPPATTVIITAGVRPGIRYCDACAETSRTTLERHRIPFESAAIIKQAPASTGAGRR